MYQVGLKDEEQTLRFGAVLAAFIEQSQRPLTVVFLHGNLGAGKTTLSRGALRALGHEGAVKSPTYTLVEHYALDSCDFYHFDIYRLSDPEELEYMGIRDFLSAADKPVVCLIEWPEKGQGFLPKADLDVSLHITGKEREARIHSGLAWDKAAFEELRALLKQAEFDVFEGA